MSQVQVGVWLFRVIRKPDFSYFVTRDCDVEHNKGWFILQALKAFSKRKRKLTFLTYKQNQIDILYALCHLKYKKTKPQTLGYSLISTLV